MINKRRFHRIQLSAKTVVNHLGELHEGVLGAISLGGAAINFNGSAMIPEGDECLVAIELDESLPALELTAKVTNSSFYRIGVAFVHLEQHNKDLLYDLLKKLTSEPQTLESERQLFIAIS